MNSELHSEAVIERVWRCTWRLRLIELRNALGGCNRASLEMHFEGHDRPSLEMHFEAVIHVIERVWRHNWRPRISELTDALRGRDRASSDMHFDLEVVDGRRGRCGDCIHRLVNSKSSECDSVTSPLKLLSRNGWSQTICWEVRRKRKLHSGINSKSRE